MRAGSRHRSDTQNGQVLMSQHIFYPVLVETHGPLIEDAHQLLNELCRRISASSGDDDEVLFLLQPVSVAG